MNTESQRNPVEALAEDFLARYRRGERPSLGEYTRQHPELAGQIRELFPALVLMEEVAPDEEPRPGAALTRLGEYRILREIGRGGMGVVYEAEQEALGRHVALKVLPPAAAADQVQLQRFHREARAAARLHHTNIVPVFDVGEHQGTHYYAMQFIQGEGLDAILDELRRLRPPASQPAPATPRHRAVDRTLTLQLAQGLLTGLADGPAADGPTGTAPADTAPPPPLRLPGPRTAATGDFSDPSTLGYYRAVARLGLQAAEALAHAHGQGVLHRDIKPSNLLLDTHGTVWVTDFGLAKATDSDDLTHTGDVVGTLRYMAPERLQGQSDPRSDLYGLGVTLYELLTLRPAFDEADRGKLLGRVLHEEPPRPRRVNPEVPRDLETIALKAMAKEPARRYQSARELADDLQRFLADRPIRARRSGVWEYTWRWCRRNRLAASLAGLLALILLAAGVGGLLSAYQFRSLALQAEEAKRQAEDNARQIRQSMERQNRAYQLLERGNVHVAGGGLHSALADYTEAATLLPDSAAVWTARGQLYEALRLYEPAAQDLARAFELQRSPEANVWWDHAALRLQVRDARGYAQVCSDMLKHFGTGGEARSSWWRAVTFSLGANSGVDPELTVKLAQKALAQEPTSRSYTVTLATALYRAGRAREALRCLQELDVRGDKGADVETQPLLAMIHSRLGNRKEARLWMERAGQTFDRDLWAMRPYPFRLSYEYIGSYDTLRFILFYREARGQVPEAPPDEEIFCTINQARAYAFLGQPALAEIYFSRAIEQQPTKPVLWSIRGVFRAEQGQWSRALADFERANALQPVDDFWELGWRAIVQLRLGAADAYADTCRHMMKRYGQSDDPAPASHTAWVCSLAPGAIEDAAAPVRLAERSVKGAPQDPRCHLALGAALYRAGRYQQAACRLRQAMKMSSPKVLEPDGTALAQLFLSMALQRLGENREAARLLKSASGAIDRAGAVERKGDLEPGWFVWAACQVVRREAEALARGRGRDAAGG
jgi:serine/threonine protein kinase/Flp pilus assembly protein TadD